MRFLIPLCCVGILGTFLLFVSLAGIPRQLKARLQVIVFLAFFIRLSLATAFAIYPQFRVCHDDANGYEVTAVETARYWHGQGPPSYNLVGREKWYNLGYFYVGAALCYVFGAYTLHLSLWNALFGALTVVVIYRLAARLFHGAVALRAALLLAFMPSMILWSAVAIKDPLLVLLIALGLYLFVILRQRWSLTLAVLLAGIILGILSIRFYISYFMVLSLLGTAVISRPQEGFRIRRNLLVPSIFGLIVALTGVRSYFTEGLEVMDLDRVASYRVGMASTANSGFANDVDVRSLSGLMVAMPMGLAVLLFGPFPWQMRGLLSMMMAPELILWWSLAPSLWRGLRFAFERAFTRASPVFVFFISLLFGLSLTMGNVGAAVRQRAQIFVFLFIFVALGQYVKQCRRRRLDLSLLLQPGEQGRSVQAGQAV